MAVKAFVFDLGETLMDERRHWAIVAEAVGVGHERLWSALEDVAACGVQHCQLFDDLGDARPHVAAEWVPAWCVDKPAPEFSEHVGDRVDNDVLTALAAGMVAVHLPRGPWWRSRKAPPEAGTIESLHELPEAVGG
ncbi:MAG: hypothetical protein ACYDA3_09125 [Gaiellaceae bacterium]